MFARKVVLVTGGSSGIGRATALAFAKGGASVVIAARGAERGEATVEEIVKAGGKALFVQTDVSRTEEVAALVEKVVETHGRLDCAFNNAAGSPERPAPLGDISEEEFDRTVDSNLKSVWSCMKHELGQMMRQYPAGGAIVNTSSVNGLGGVRGGSLYAATKAGVIALTKSAALEYAASGIRVNVLVPGAFRTPMLEGAIEQHAQGNEEVRQATVKLYESFIAQRRIGNPEEAAQAVLWLCSEQASYVRPEIL